MNKWVIKMTRSAMEGINYLAVTLYENEKLVAAEIVSSPTEACIFTTKKKMQITLSDSFSIVILSGIIGMPKYAIIVKK